MEIGDELQKHRLVELRIVTRHESTKTILERPGDSKPVVLSLAVAMDDTLQWTDPIVYQKAGTSWIDKVFRTQSEASVKRDIQGKGPHEAGSLPLGRCDWFILVTSIIGTSKPSHPVATFTNIIYNMRVGRANIFPELTNGRVATEVQSFIKRERDKGEASVKRVQILIESSAMKCRRERRGDLATTTREHMWKLPRLGGDEAEMVLDRRENEVEPATIWRESRKRKDWGVGEHSSGMMFYRMSLSTSTAVLSLDKMEVNFQLKRRENTRAKRHLKHDSRWVEHEPMKEKTVSSDYVFVRVMEASFAPVFLTQNRSSNSITSFFYF
ncbi:hypothetical protein C8R42DRAFT_648512 [Lentinula raphanica]|nr:hypothetical protein C8R42DRAFT_648512 [Lentinula raphanica]